MVTKPQKEEWTIGVRKFELSQTVRFRTIDGTQVGIVIGYEDGRRIGANGKRCKGWMYHVLVSGERFVIREEDLSE